MIENDIHLHNIVPQDGYPDFWAWLGYEAQPEIDHARIQQDFIRALVDYIQGESRSETYARLTHCARQAKLSAYKISNDIDHNDPNVIIILRSLGLSQMDTQRYMQRSTNLYSLLVELAWDQKPQCAELIADIDAIHSQSWFEFFSTLMLSLGSLSALTYLIDAEAFFAIAYLLAAQLQALWGWFHDLFDLTRNAPLLGLAWQTFLLLHLWYQVLTTGIRMHQDTRVILFFRTLHQLIMIAKDLLFYMAAATMTPWVAGLFILAALVDLVQHCYLPLLRYFQWRPAYAHDEIHLLVAANESIEYVDAIKPAHRAFYDYHHGFDTAIFWTNFVALGALVLIMGVSVSFPPSLLLTLSCLVATWVVNLSKNQLILYFNQQAIDRRQQTLIQDLQFNPQAVLNIPKIIQRPPEDAPRHCSSPDNDDMIAGLPQPY